MPSPREPHTSARVQITVLAPSERVHYEKTPARIPAHGYVLWIHKGSRFECINAALLKRLVTAAEQLAIEGCP
jgi:hypothetical protein